MNNLAGPLVYYYDVGKFSCNNIQIHQNSACFCNYMMVQPTIIRNGIGYALIQLQSSLASTKVLAQWHTCQPHTIPLGAATLVAYSSSRVK